MRMLLSFKTQSILPALLICCMLLMVSCQNEEEATPDLVQEEYTLMSTFLNESLSEGKVVVDEYTSHPLSGIWTFGNDKAVVAERLQGYVPDADPALIEQMLNLAEDTTLHERSFSSYNNEVVVLTAAERAQIFRSDRTAAENWSEFTDQFGDGENLFIISRVAFNEDRTQALFSVINYFIQTNDNLPDGYNVGYGNLVFFSKQPDTDEWVSEPVVATAWVLN